MASHRRPRPRTLSAPRTRAAAGLTTAAFATAALLTETAAATPSAPRPRPSVSEVKDRVDLLYREAASATDRYNGAKERTDKQRGTVDRLLDQVASDTRTLNDSRRRLGRYAAEQYRTGGLAPTTTLFLAENPEDYFSRNHLMDRLADGQRAAVKDFTTKQLGANKKRREASEGLVGLTRAQKDLAKQKRAVQRKLGEARSLLADLTAEERARLKELERRKRAAALKRAEELAKKEAERKAAERREQEAGTGPGSPEGGTGTGTGGSPVGGTSDGTYASKARKVVAFAEAQLGKPYVWGATGPNSYDCSGLTQAAWKAAGVSLPRTTWDQVNVGKRVATSALEPGDLVFFYNDISHVGLYIGGGKMIHAPKPGDVVQISPITEMPVHGSVRPA